MMGEEVHPKRYLIVYHDADLDGHCSGAIALSRYPQASMLGMDYGRPFPMEDVLGHYDAILMADFSLSPEEMDRLHRTKEFLWIDHHKTAIESVNVSIPGLRETRFAACELTWHALFGSRPPLAVRLMGRYDVWDKENPSWRTQILPFQRGFKFLHPNSDPGDPNNVALWQRMFQDGNGALIQRIMDAGDRFIHWREATDAQLLRKNAFRCEAFDRQALCINRGPANSQLFESMYDPDVDEIMVAFWYDGRLWRVSLYSETIDVSEIAREHGGGGHKGAAGFTCAVLPEDLRASEDLVTE